ncbi:hypothetical protein Micbo1qcDRAFT_174318 [Microdochium bolleyi]|uniref:C2H2-type domain-containing protein n=1 Tax=Microdochium bolleyi TaxID=196109 RepID=A0A136J7U2_9PEZI|nr:hypothetical protein Micbo1qcDRAFT_174318 [Microdochium bolleyi]
MSSAWTTQTYLPAIEPRKCPCCEQVFDTGKDKVEHQNAAGHFQCVICKRQFLNGPAVVKHQLQDHKRVHKITCPGCTAVYTSAGDWLDHIERNICTGIFPEALEIRRQQLEAFRSALANRSSTRDFAVLYEHTDTWADHIPGPVYDNFDAHHGTVLEQEYKEESAFPRLPTNQFRAGDSKTLDLLSGDATVPAGRSANKWANSKSLFPGRNSYTAVPPPESQSRATGTKSATSCKDDSGAPCKDPYDPRFNPAIFKNPILDMFTCPHLTCSTKTNTAQGLVRHLKSPVHQAEPEICPSCLRSFPGKTALLRHIEASFVKCYCKNADKFRQILSTLTGGVLDAKVNVKDENGEKRELSVDEICGEMTEIYVDEKAAANLQPGRARGSGPGFWEGSELLSKGSGKARGW